jgi:hypothetical protein
MPAVTVAVSGRARAVSSWLNLVDRLGYGADDRNAGGSCAFPPQGTGATPTCN